MFRTVLALSTVAALLSGCENEVGGLTEIPPVDRGYLDAVPMPLDEEPRFYFLAPTYAPAVSDDGQVLLWEWETGGDTFIWTEEGGLDWVTTTGAYFNSVHDISADGTKIIGSYGNYMNDEVTQAATWTEVDGWQKLGALPTTLNCPSQSSGYALTADGTEAGGLAWDGCNGQAFRWDSAGGMVPMESLGNGGNRASAMSDGGELLVGFAQGNFSRTPAVWYPDGTGEVLNMAFTGEFYGTNAAGTKAVGQLGSKAAIWDVEEGHTFLGNLGGPGESSSTARTFCGSDDAMVVGSDSFAGTVGAAWTESTGWVNLRELLEAHGVEFPANTRLFDAMACTPDRTHLVGHASVDDEIGSYVVVLPEGTLDDLFE
ncbi:MAG: hypothetical protein KC912_22460 [Proteobacteria bacterium]|nr:hypothetical protein [Pseudomonadota bacterium]